ncbi:hypothetical protein ISCGN_003239 [Ixodes scapularis]
MRTESERRGGAGDEATYSPTAARAPEFELEVTVDPVDLWRCGGSLVGCSRSGNRLDATWLPQDLEILVATSLDSIFFCGPARTMGERGSFAEAVSSRGPAPSKVSVATQVSFSDHGKPLQSSTPRLKLALPGHSISAAKAADPTSRTKDIGAAAATEVTPSSLPPGPSPQATERVSRSSSPGRTSPSRRQHVPRATDDTGGTASRPSTSTAAPSGQCRGRGLPLRSVDNSKASASTSGQGLTPPAPPGPLARKGRGLPPRTSAPQRKPGEPPKQSTSKGQLPVATDEPMDEGGPRSEVDAPLS